MKGIKTIDDHDWFDDDVTRVDISPPQDNGYGTDTEIAAIIHIEGYPLGWICQNVDDLEKIANAMGYNMVKQGEK